MGLSRTHFDTLQRAILDLHHPRDVSAFKKAAIRNVLDLLPSRHVLFVLSEVEMTTRSARVVDLWESTPRLVPGLVTRMTRAGLGHPFTTFTLRTSDAAALRFSDVFSVRAFDRPGLHERFHRHVGNEQRLGATCLDGSELATLTVIRRSEEPRFTRRDRQILESLFPHILLAFRNARHVTERTAREAVSGDTSDLTPREIQVARQLVLGRTNPEIGVALRIRARTVEKHVEKILAKLGVENRTAAAIIIAGWGRSG